MTRGIGPLPAERDSAVRRITTDAQILSSDFYEHFCGYFLSVFIRFHPRPDKGDERLMQEVREKKFFILILSFIYSVFICVYLCSSVSH
jgi:hypothetical protein